MTEAFLTELGKSSSAVNACIPLNMNATKPRLQYQECWIAEYWYYASDYQDQSVCAPMYYMAFELPSGHPLCFCRLQKTRVCLGKEPAIITNDFYARENSYMKHCVEAVNSGSVSQADLDSLEEEWLGTLPAPLKDWIGENKSTLRYILESETKDSSQPKNLTEYWKLRMADAIRMGDSAGAKEAQKELNKVTKTK